MSSTPRAFKNDGRPAGMHVITDRMREAVERHAAGASIRELSAHYGVSRSTVSAWLEKVAEAIADERNLAQLRR